MRGLTGISTIFCPLLAYNSIAWPACRLTSRLPVGSLCSVLCCIMRVNLDPRRSLRSGALSIAFSNGNLRLFC